MDPRPDPPADTEPSDGPEPGRALVGATLNGRYTLHREIGSGAMGTVFLATDARLHGRECAVKVLQAHTNPDERARFERELRIVSMLRSPHVVQVLDSGALEDGRPYIVMELLVGSSLHEYIRRHGPLTPDLAVGVGVDVLQGLAEAHALGVVHRDLKPANVFIIPRADGGLSAKVLDFGVAKQIHREDDDITQARASVGTPRYMAPEQFLNEPVGPRTDLYGVGVLLHTALRGRPPYLAGDAVPDEVARLPTTSRLAWLHLNAPPPTLEGVPPALNALIARLMAKHPDQRPVSARAVVDALQSLDEPDAATDPPPALEPPAPRRNRRAALIALFAVLGTVGGVALAWWQTPPPCQH
ncbi:MAG: serine/threonine protein kinase, partial [Myxococcales bacterium]|nr:serine/threonine protein kinase [Myxococcales bacterium]